MKVSGGFPWTKMVELINYSFNVLKSYEDII